MANLLGLSPLICKMGLPSHSLCCRVGVGDVGDGTGEGLSHFLDFHFWDPPSLADGSG